MRGVQMAPGVMTVREVATMPGERVMMVPMTRAVTMMPAAPQVMTISAPPPPPPTMSNQLVSREVITGPTVYLIQIYNDNTSELTSENPFVVVSYAGQKQATPSLRYEGGYCAINYFMSFAWREGKEMQIWVVDKHRSNEILSVKPLVPERLPRGQGGGPQDASTLPRMPFPPGDTWFGDLPLRDELGRRRGQLSACIYLGREPGRIGPPTMPVSAPPTTYSSVSPATMAMDVTFAPSPTSLQMERPGF